MRTDYKGFAVEKKMYICSMATVSNSRSGGTSAASGSVPASSASGVGRSVAIGNTRNAPSRSGNSARVKKTYGLSDWQYYADSNGVVTSPPNYPDVSYGAYLAAGGNLLGIGYNSWRDQRLAAYNTAYNMYQQWYDATPQQVARLAEAGLNTNLGYSMASPGSSPGGARAETSGPSPEQVFFGGINALTGLASGTKALAEAATIVNELPESKLKGQIARQIDSAAKAGAINAENTYLGSLYGARNALGLGRSKAEQEKAEQAYNTAHNEASKSLLDYMTSHDENGNETDFAGSVYNRGEVSNRAAAIYEYKKVKQEWSQLLSNPKYWKARLDKLEADAYISHSQAWQARKILENPNMDDQAKFLALQPGLPGFFAKLSFSITDQLIEGFNNTKQTIRGWFNHETRNP